MVLDVIVHKFVVSDIKGRGGKYGKVSTIGVLENNTGPTTDMEGMDTLSMAVSMVGMTCSDVVAPTDRSKSTGRQS